MSELLRSMPGRPARPSDFEGLEIFAGLGAEVHEWIADHATVIDVEPDQIVIEYGDAAAEMFVLLSGEFEFAFHLFEGETTYGTYVPGEVTGLLPFSRMETYPGRGVAVEPSRVLWIGKEHFTEMVQRSPELGGRLVAIMADRVRDATRVGEQRDRMAALGKLSAGLAHELNNPASAVRRSADALRQRLKSLPGLVARLAEKDLKYEQVCLADRLRERAFGKPVRLSAMERSEREDAMGDWLEDHGISEPWVRAETLVDAGLTPDDVAASVDGLPDDSLSDLLAWVEGGMAAERLLSEIEEAAVRISDLVSAVKAYSHVDRGRERQPIDIREGVETTLRILDHKMRRKNIRVEWDWEDDLPPVSGYPGELNQVWTNLIDNAVDAMADGGTLRLGAARVSDHVEVCVTDDGAGIPEDLQSRIFDPFFTTKDVGEGTGLGLDIVRRIVAGTHQGSIDVESEPGRTTFRLHLPAA